ncbi:hypothetical protein [Saccharothrix coeruleofusca]|uniref:Uncharacterized protein n=1 Tax=Saccharothrix coeruleofusca TaxID=33919 RepID=A0A918AGP4_9PSEU|nr:hypothetical protein [Saccharothrix coeruleofusca]MBP2340624.1 hypothetical protein [Saccharothrix coeruleofusca]GGP34229.1 hypothetical protein GCM10010185_00950 [Saccharothrix coeruleofusca]
MTTEELFSHLETPEPQAPIAQVEQPRSYEGLFREPGAPAGGGAHR